MIQPRHLMNHTNRVIPGYSPDPFMQKPNHQFTRMGARHSHSNYGDSAAILIEGQYVSASLVSYSSSGIQLETSGDLKVATGQSLQVATCAGLFLTSVRQVKITAEKTTLSLRMETHVESFDPTVKPNRKIRREAKAHGNTDWSITRILVFIVSSMVIGLLIVGLQAFN